MILVFCVYVGEGMHACVCVRVRVSARALSHACTDLAVDVNKMKFSEFFILN